MADELKERAEKSSLDHMTSTAQTALALGAGAVLFYRGGGRKALSKGLGVSSRVLNEASNEFSKLSLSTLTTSDLKNVYNRTFKGSESALAKAKEEVSGTRFKIRTNNQHNIVGVMNNAASQLFRDPEGTIVRPAFNQQYVVNPLANKFMNKFGGDNELLRRNIGQFTQEAVKHMDDINVVLNRVKELKVGSVIKPTDVEDILSEIKTFSKTQESKYYHEFKKTQVSAIEQAQQVAFDYENIANKMGARGESLVESALGDRHATVDDVLNNKDLFMGNLINTARRKGGLEKGDVVQEEAVEFLQRFRDQVQREKGEDAAIAFGQTIFDKTLRIDEKGQFHNFAETKDILDEQMDRFASTMLGKIGKVRDFREISKAPAVRVFNASVAKADPVLAKLTNKKNKQSMLPEENFVRIYDKSYRVTDRGLVHEQALDNTYLISRYGTVKKTLDQISGNEAYKEKGSNWLFEKLNIGKEGQPTILDDMRTRVSKLEDPEWIGNVVPKFARNPQSVVVDTTLANLMNSPEKMQVANSLMNQVMTLNSFYSKNVYDLSKESVQKISANMGKESKELMELTLLQDSDMVQSILKSESFGFNDLDKFYNKDLSSLLREYKTNPKRALDMVSMKSNRGNALGGNESATFHDLLRMELSKESFLRHARDSSDEMGSINYNAINELIDSAGLSKESTREASRLADWAIFQDIGGINSRATKGLTNADDLLKKAEEAADVFIKREGDTPQNAVIDRMKKNLEELEQEKTSLFDTDYGAYMDGENIVRPYKSPEWAFMNKAVSPMDVIKNLNDGTTAKAFVKQFYAGRNNLEDVTTATMVPYFFGVRLSDALSKVGLSLGVEDKESIGSLTKAMVLKRGLPIVGAMMGYDYVSDMTGVITGENLTTHLASGVANIDLGVRRAIDTVGLSDFLKDEKELNPLLRYWTGDTYMNEEERRDWYQNGYQEMRKSRWWNFGGISEFRGSEIQYFQPNYLRRISSNWKDESLYDNVWEKWSHSWLPTPTNPISPLIYMADPYYIENKFADERPYPMTGKMFTEETPWGPALNATIGELIKPQKRMHTDRLDENFVDSQVIIEAENQAIYERARNGDGGNHLIRFKDGAIEPVTFTSLDAPTASQRLINIKSYNGEVQQAQGGTAYGAYEGVTNASELSFNENGFGPPGYSAALGGGVGGSGEGQANYFQPISDLSYEDDLTLKAAKGEIGAVIKQTVLGATALGQIESLNEEVYQVAAANSQMSALGMPTGRGIITTESIYQAGASFGSSVLNNSEALSDLKGLSAGDDFIGEMAYTSRFAAGIYGYGLFAMFPGQPSTKLSDASDIASPVRSFWDANTGGLGGGYLEIFRRFIPAANHKQEDFNPLLNTMEDWLPEKFRLGDPYTKLPKGEMRLPGRGYEAIYDLHPDQYGEYGAFDRFKILADIAPTSSEYKVWRDITSKTVKDPYLRDEMDEIKERVKKQNEKFDFFDYQFLGRGVNRERLVVDQVIDNNHFTTVGSDKVYKMAGITVGNRGDENFSLKNYLLSGTEVVVATDKDPYRGTNDDEYRSVNAAVFADGVNINETLMDEGYAERRQNDSSAAAVMANFSDFQIMRGKAYEALSHLPVPYLQQKFFKIRDPLESYKHEFVYGTSYASWSNPIDSFLMPGIERSLMSDTEMVVGLGGMAINRFAHENSSNSMVKRLATGAYAFSNRGAFIGAFFALGTGNTGSVLRKSMNIGAIAQGAGWLATRSDQPIEATAGFAAVGAAAGHLLKDVGIKKGAMLGALAGLTISGAKSSVLEDGLDKDWLPERTKKKWELQEYFDRLSYIKYSGLYEKAARKAELLEGTDIKELVNSYEESREKNFELRAKLEDAKSIVEKAYDGKDERGQRLLREIESKLASIESSEFAVSVGSYGKSALAYKQAMDSTAYGLNKDASWAELIRSIPTSERNHFLEFVKEQNPDKRKEILKVVSPYMHKVLQTAWGEEREEHESNESYFKDMNIPPPTWSGWRPDVDLKDVQVKTIQNEGMLLSDFGFYESQLRDKDVINAPKLNPHGEDNQLVMLSSIQAALKGMGLVGVDVNISPSHRSGIEVAANIMNTAAQAPAYIESRVRHMLSF